VGLERGLLSLVSTIEELLERSFSRASVVFSILMMEVKISSETSDSVRSTWR
jgi:hypothetical protein